MPHKFHSVRESIGVYAEPRILALVFLGFASGLPLALSASTLLTWMTEAGVDLTTIGVFALVGMPYAFKYIWAPVVDQVPIPGLTRWFGRRRGWMLLTQGLLILSILLLGQADPVVAPGVTAAIAVAVAFFSATQDIAVDAYRIESLEQDQQAAGAAAAVLGYRVGMLVSGAGSLYLASAYDWQTAYQVMAGFMSVGVLTVLLRPEPAGRVIGAAVAGSWVARAVIAPFADFAARKGWLLILLFIICFKFGETLAGVMTNPFLIMIGFSKNEIATVSKLFGFWATLGGLAIGGMLMMRLGLIASLWVSGILQLLTNFLFAYQAMVGADLTILAVTIGFENLAGGMGTAVFVAYLSSLCSRDYTATQYALLSALAVTGRTMLSATGGYLAEVLGWAPFFIATAGAAVPGLLLLWWLTRSGIHDGKKGALAAPPPS